MDDTVLKQPQVVGKPDLSLGFFVARFEFMRIPGLQASGIIIVPKDAVGNWNRSLFFTPLPSAQSQTHIDVFKLADKDAQEQQVILQAVHNVQYLVFRDGELAGVDGKETETFNVLLKQTTPLFDEYAILATLAQDPKYRDSLLTPNTFGTWSEVVLTRISERCGYVLGWKTVGYDNRLMPTKDKLLRLQSSSQANYQLVEENRPEFVPSHTKTYNLVNGEN